MSFVYVVLPDQSVDLEAKILKQNNSGNLSLLLHKLVYNSFNDLNYYKKVKPYYHANSRFQFMMGFALI